MNCFNRAQKCSKAAEYCLMLIVLSVGSLPEEQPDLQSPPQSIFAPQAHAEALFL